MPEFFGEARIRLVADQEAQELLLRHKSWPSRLVNGRQHRDWPAINGDGDGLAGLHAIEQRARVVAQFTRGRGCHAGHCSICATTVARRRGNVHGSSTIALLGFVTLFVLGSPSQTTAYLVPESGVTIIAVLAFVLPLRVMHSRLSAEKEALQADDQTRLKAVLGRLHEAVESDNLTRADQLEKTLNAVLAERELLNRLPTWPWTTGTFRGVASAVLLPIVIFILTRAIDRLL